MNRIVPAAILAASLVACSSPEATRTRGGGAGADKGNRGEAVLMHEGSRPYAGTPLLIPSQGPSLDSARQAHRLSSSK
jgi:hypothetical protein